MGRTTQRPTELPARTVQEVLDREGALPTGTEGQNVPTDFHIPEAGLGDVDRAVFELFEERLRLEVTVNESKTRVPTLFAGAERVFLVKKNRPPRDRNGLFVLPIVSIRRTGLEQSELGVIVGRGMGQDTGELVIRKRLSTRDPRYQNLVNKPNLKNQDNVASPLNRLGTSAPQGAIPGRVASRRARVGSFSTASGDILRPDVDRNIFEIITMPFPHFYTALYEVTIWTQYVQHMNEVLETFMTSYDAQGNQFRLDTDKGYWYVAYVDTDLISEDNFTDYTEDERFVRYKLTMRVPAYLHASQRKGSGIPFRRFLSAPQLSFEALEGAIPAYERKDAPVGSGDVDKFALSDITRLDKRGNPIQGTREFVRNVELPDPFSDGNGTMLRRIAGGNQRKGETMNRRVSRHVDDFNV